MYFEFGSVVQYKLMFEDLFCLSTGGYIVLRTITFCTILVEGVITYKEHFCEIIGARARVGNFIYGG